MVCARRCCHTGYVALAALRVARCLPPQARKHLLAVAAARSAGRAGAQRRRDAQRQEDRLGRVGYHWRRPRVRGHRQPRHRRRLRPCARRAPLLACVLFRQLEAKCRLLLNHGIVPASCGLGLGPGLWGPPGMIPHGRGLSSVSAAPFIALRSVQPAAGSLADRRASWEPWQAW